MGNGVKQGGVISPILFNLYIDRLLIRLQKSGVGCHINNIYMRALSYADDITISCHIFFCQEEFFSNNFLNKKVQCWNYRHD